MAWFSASCMIIPLLLLFNTEGVRYCAPGSYGESCDQPCPQHCALQSGSTVGDCDRDTGGCYEGCVPGWYGDHCNQSCGRNCINSTCNRINGHCTKGCEEKYFGDFCREVLIDGVRQCIPGYYEESCDQPCPKNCAPQSGSTVGDCDRHTGGCFEGCVPGWYGDHCNQSCNRNCKDNVCNRDDGHCYLGCKEKNITGDFCTKVLTYGGETRCVPGLHGTSCVLPCPGRCAMQRESDVQECHTHTAICYRGCRTGWYGDHCNFTCNNNCQENICNRNTGICYGRCRPGSYGDYCNKTCNCMNGTCNKDNGHCTYSCDGPSCPKDSDSQDYTVPIVSSIAVVLGTLIPTLFICILQRQQMIQYIRGRLLRCRAKNDRSERKLLNPKTNQEHELQVVTTPEHRQDTDLQRLASSEGNQEAIKQIQVAGRADVNSGDWDGKTPIMVAAESGQRQMVECLVSEGADVSQVDTNGNNTLHFACQGGDVDTVKFVLSLNKVDLNARDNYGRTASDVAKHYRHEQVVHLLETRGVTSV